MKQIRKAELLAPAGSIDKFYTALHFGADAVYLAGKQYGLRAYADNFTVEEIALCCKYAHERGKKVYVTVNIFARNADFEGLEGYLRSLYACNVDAVIVSDAGIVEFIREKAIDLEIHLSTQTSTLNNYAVKFWAQRGVKRIVLARECSLSEIREIATQADKYGVEIETFIHGAMCISYSGRCLLSNYLTGRDSNKGECVQACRWEFKILEASRNGDPLTLCEEDKTAYILNSKDLNMLEYIPELVDAGIASFKIEGRMKSPYYVATVVNAYRRAIDAFYENGSRADTQLINELFKASHRKYTTGFYFDDTHKQYYESSKAVAESEFIAVVKDFSNGVAIVEQRNRFCTGDELEILSANQSFGKRFVVKKMTDLEGNAIDDAKLVQQILLVDCPYELKPFDIFRKNHE
ncbi:MAG: U32 family peptidase [Clostridia bacterium]|nr:U32 family peptidase [Clostridia bacterium]